MDFETCTFGESSATRSWYDMVIEEEDHLQRDSQLPESTYPIIPRSSAEAPRPSSLDFEFTPLTEQERFQPLTSTPRRNHHNRRRNNNSRQNTPSSRRGDRHKENVSPSSHQQFSPLTSRPTRRDQERHRNRPRSAVLPRDDSTPIRDGRSPLRRPLGERQTAGEPRRTSDSWAQLVSGVSPTSSRPASVSPSTVSLERNLDQEFTGTTAPRERYPASLNDTFSELDLSYGFDDSMVLTDDSSASAASKNPSSPSSAAARSPSPSASRPVSSTLKRTTSEPQDIESGLRATKRPCYLPTLDDPHRLAQRQKQIDFGKNTIGYDIYTKTVPRVERSVGMPRTPDKRLNCSKRQFDGLLKSWRRQLHTFDPDYAVKTGSQSFADLSDSALGQSVCTDTEFESPAKKTSPESAIGATTRLCGLDFGLDADIFQGMQAA